MQVKIYETEDQKKELSEICEGFEKRFKYFREDMIRFRSYIVLFVENIAVGIVGITNRSMYNEKHFGLSFVSVAYDQQNKGYAKKLVHELFEHAVRCKKGINVTPYTDEGKKYLKPIIRKYNEQYMGIVQVEERSS